MSDGDWSDEELAKTLGVFDERWVMDWYDLADDLGIYMCPGCQRWQIEFDPTRLNMWAEPLIEALREHRRECPAFDMLAGLQGHPHPDSAG